MTEILVQLFIISFFINLLWEIQHSVLYTTCHKISLDKYTRLITIMSLKDAFWVSIFYFITTIIFNEKNIFLNMWALGFFVLISLIFSFIDERISIKKGRWEYGKSMPRVFGVGITPLLEILVTGIISLYLIFFII